MFELINFLTLFLIVLHTIVFVTISPRQRRVGGRNTVNDYQSSGCAFYAAFPPFYRTLHASLPPDIWEFVIWVLYPGASRVVLC